MTTLAKPQLVRCPYCKTSKRLVRMASWNTFGARYWSDKRNLFPHALKVSFVQKCEDCGKYNLPSRQRIRTARDGRGVTGKLDWDDIL